MKSIASKSCYRAFVISIFLPFLFFLSDKLWKLQEWLNLRTSFSWVWYRGGWRRDLLGEIMRRNWGLEVKNTFFDFYEIYYLSFDRFLFFFFTFWVTKFDEKWYILKIIFTNFLQICNFWFFYCNFLFYYISNKWKKFFSF